MRTAKPVKLQIRVSCHTGQLAESTFTRLWSDNWPPLCRQQRTENHLLPRTHMLWLVGTVVPESLTWTWTWWPDKMSSLFKNVPICPHKDRCTTTNTPLANRLLCWSWASLPRSLNLHGNSYYGDSPPPPPPSLLLPPQPRELVTHLSDLTQGHC